MKPVLIIGVGNLLRTDDGVGVHAINLLNDSGKLPEYVEAVDAGTCTLDLPALIMGRKRVILIDALESDGEPGTIYKLPASYLSGSGENRCSLHKAGVVSAIRSIRMVDECPDVEVIGIVPQDVFTLGTEPTPMVKAALQKVVELVLASVVDSHVGT
jgi:hydrogenase maturation protease